MNLGNIITRAANYWPQKEAVVDARNRLTYRDLESQTNRLASGLLAMGLAPGNRVAIQALNCAELAVAEIAFYKAGLVKVPVNARLTVDETVHVLNDSRAHAVIAGKSQTVAIMANRSQLPHLENVIAIEGDEGDHRYQDILDKGEDVSPGADPADDEVAVLHYTSGSSGVLKAAMQSFGNRKAIVRKMLTSPSSKARVGSRMAHVGPVTHASGMSMMPLFYYGGCNIMLDRFDLVELLETIQKEKVNSIFMVPTMINRIINFLDIDKYDLSSLQNVTYGAAPMAPSVVEKAMNTFGPILSQGYGAGETSSVVTVLTEQDHIDALAGDKKRLASCGRCYFETDVQVLKDDGQPVKPGEIGEIVVRGPDVMMGYWGAPELTEEVIRDGAYLTGDLATVDDEGYIFIVDRKKEMIISGGFNVYPSEVEKVLYEHPAIFEAAVIGVPDEEWGEAVKAVVVKKPDAEVSADDILQYCKDNLPGFKRPRSVDFTDELPKNPNGKIVRRQVRDPYWADSDRKVG